MRVSTHMDVKPYQVAITTDPNLELRKWQHMCTHWDVSHLSAAFRFGNGEVVREFIKHDGIVFQFSDGKFIHVTV